MFYNALLMICWFGAIPLSYMSSPQVQSCDSLMKRAWWKLWDNIIFGGVPYEALRLVRDPVRGNLAGLMVHSCAAGSTRQFITVCRVGNLAFLSIFTILCLQINITACWLSGSSPFQFSVNTRREALGEANTKLKSALSVITSYFKKRRGLHVAVALWGQSVY